MGGEQEGRGEKGSFGKKEQDLMHRFRQASWPAGHDQQREYLKLLLIVPALGSKGDRVEP